MINPPSLTDPPPLHAIMQGTVRRVAAFGVFVEMDGYQSWGLVHFTQMSDYLSFAKDDSEEEKIATLEEIAPVGQRVWVKVVEVGQQDQGQRAKVSCSMKLVNQRVCVGGYSLGLGVRMCEHGDDIAACDSHSILTVLTIDIPTRKTSPSFHAHRMGVTSTQGIRNTGPAERGEEGGPGGPPVSGTMRDAQQGVHV